jgi:hypothetical protein
MFKVFASIFFILFGLSALGLTIQYLNFIIALAAIVAGVALATGY